MTSSTSFPPNTSELDGLKASIPSTPLSINEFTSICATKPNIVEIDELEERVIQRIKHSPLAKLLASHKVPSALHKISDKEVKE